MVADNVLLENRCLWYCEQQVDMQISEIGAPEQSVYGETRVQMNGIKRCLKRKRLWAIQRRS